MTTSKKQSEDHFPGSDSPVSAAEIDTLPYVLGHFQKDTAHQTSYATDESLESLAEISSICLKFASKLGNSEFGALNNVSAFTGKTKTVMFALDSSRSEPAGVRVFGVKMAASADTDVTVQQIHTYV